ATKRYWRKLNWASAEFALLADVAMGALGGNLKRKEKLTGRYADWFSWMFIASATLRRFEAEGRKPEDLPLVQWSLEHAFHKVQQARAGIYQNLRLPVIGGIFGTLGGLMARLNPMGSLPNDKLGHQTAVTLLQP